MGRRGGGGGVGDGGVGYHSEWSMWKWKSCMYDLMPQCVMRL